MPKGVGYKGAAKKAKNRNKKPSPKMLGTGMARRAAEAIKKRHKRLQDL